MPRVKRGKIHLKKRKKLLKAVKGYKWGRKNKIKLARPAMLKAGMHAFRDRRAKKRTRRALWQIQINAACRKHNVSYSSFVNLLKKAGSQLDRKVLARLAQESPALFGKIIEKIKV